jgi:O-antigen ligase
MNLYVVLAVPALLLLFYLGWVQLKFLFYFLLLLVPFSIEYQVTGSLATDFPDEIIMVLCTMLAVYHGFNKWDDLTGRLKHPLVFILIAWFCWIFLAALFSSDPVVSFKYLLAKTWYLGAFIIVPLLVFKTSQDLSRAVWALGGSMLAVAIIIFTRHLNYSLRFTDVNLAVTPFFRNHVNYAALLVCCIPLFFAGFKLATSGNQKRWFVVSILFLLLALYFTYSRGAWLALGTGGLAWVLMKRKMLFPAFITAIVILSATLFWVKSNDRYLALANDFNKTIFHEDFGEHLVATYKLKDVSTAERVYRWVAGVRMVKDEVLTGYGPNTFYEHYKNYALPAFRTWVSRNTDRSTVHNYYLLVAIEQGLPGLFIFILLLGAALFFAQRSYNLAPDPFNKMAIRTSAVILTMIMVLNFLSDLIETDKIGGLFFLCLAVIIYARERSMHPSGHSPIS